MNRPNVDLLTPNRRQIGVRKKVFWALVGGKAVERNAAPVSSLPAMPTHPESRPPLHVSMRPLSAIVGALSAAGQPGGNVRFYCLNPHSYEVAREDPAFWRALSRAEALIADGSGITIARRILRLPVPPRVTGYDAFDALCRHFARGPAGGRVALLGATQTVLDAMAARLRVDYPGLEPALLLSPPFQPGFSPEAARGFAEAVNASGADLLLVGLTAPKQELLIEQMHPHLRVSAIAAIGAVFDFYAGTKPRAPEWVGRLGLEWVWRLVREPRRLWRRTFGSGARYVGGIVSGRVSRDIV